MATAVGARRVAALVLPELLVELGADWFREEMGCRGMAPTPIRELMRQPFAVVLEEDERTAELPASALLSAVNGEAERFGVRPGQRLAEARALVSELRVQALPARRVTRELQRLAEVALGFGATVGYQAPDTVWVDTTGAARLFGGEELLAMSLADRVRQASPGSGGRAARVVIAGGPRAAQAIARWGRLSREGLAVVSPEEQQARLAALPIAALPLDRERLGSLSRLGLHTVAAIAALPPELAQSRLGPSARQILELCRGTDREPLVAYQPEERLVEQSSWEEALDGLEPLKFALRGLVARLSSRLWGRCAAAQQLELVILYDRAVARLRELKPTASHRFELAAPLWREADLLRVLTARLATLRLAAPSIGLVLKAPSITRAQLPQLELGRSGAEGQVDPAERLPVLIAELEADLGEERVGVLERVDGHRLEAQSRLVAVSPRRGRSAESSPRAGRARSRREASLLLPYGPPLSAFELPTRLFQRPVELGGVLRRISPRGQVPAAPPRPPFERGATLSMGRRLYRVAEARLESRLEGVEWWSEAPVSRDYWRLTLESLSEPGERASFEALAFVDRQSGGRFLQGVYD
ncbi:MAG: DNA polymerase Y family protein [Polyangiaceae bacterium]|nr:DNA polymerase Y family protein [Polyangiaceae bacterium]MCW5791223.1 DNA polymerase Y family protein [Polyangiaceae bacterium]